MTTVDSKTTTKSDLLEPFLPKLDHFGLNVENDILENPLSVLDHVQRKTISNRYRLSH